MSIPLRVLLSWSPADLDAVVDSGRRRAVALGEAGADAVSRGRTITWSGEAANAAAARAGALRGLFDAKAEQWGQLSTSVARHQRALEDAHAHLTRVVLDARADGFHVGEDGTVTDARDWPEPEGLAERLGLEADKLVRRGDALWRQLQVKAAMDSLHATDSSLVAALGVVATNLTTIGAAAQGDPHAVQLVGLGLPEPGGTQTDDGYRIGPPDRPDFVFDDDFEYDSRQAGPHDYLLREKWQLKASGATILRPDLDDALDAYNHYWSNTGDDYVVDYEEAYQEDSSIRQAVDGEVVRAAQAADELARSSGQTSFQFTGPPSGVGSGGAYPYAATENWQKTLGAYQQWSAGDVSVDHGMVTMTVTVHADDRYNFNRGQADIASGAPDDENGRFTEIGWARPFDVSGTATRTITWPVGSPPPTADNAQVVGGPDRNLAEDRPAS